MYHGPFPPGLPSCRHLEMTGEYTPHIELGRIGDEIGYQWVCLMSDSYHGVCSDNPDGTDGSVFAPSARAVPFCGPAAVEHLRDEQALRSLVRTLTRAQKQEVNDAMANCDPTPLASPIQQRAYARGQILT